MNGKLAKAEITTTETNTMVYRVPDAALYADVHISILNPSGTTDASIKVALTTENTVVNSDYIENGASIPQGGGVLERDETISPGEKIYVSSSVAGVVVRVSGHEVATR